MIYDKIIHITKKTIILIILITNLFTKIYANTTISPNDTTLIKKYLDKSILYDNPETKSLDSSLYYIRKAQKLSEDLNNDKYTYEINRQFVQLFISSTNYPMALEYSFKIMELLENRKESQNDIDFAGYQISLLASIGIIYFELDIDLSLIYLRDAEKIALENIGTLADGNSKLSAIYNNIGSIYLRKGELDTARITYEKSLLYLDESEKNNFNRSAIYNNMGIIYMEQSHYEDAMRYYEKSLIIRKKINDKGGIAQVYNNMAKCFYMQSEYDHAIELLNKSIPLSKEKHNYRSEIIGVTTLSNIYHKKHMYKEEAMLNKRESMLKDSILAQENKGKIIELGVKYEYEKQRKQDELERQVTMAEKEKNKLILIIVISILLLLFLISVLFYRNLKIKAKKDKLQSDSLILESKNLELEKQNLLLQNSKLEQEVVNKNKELTTHVMYLVQKNQFIVSVTDKLSELSTNESKSINKQKVNSIIKQMKSNVDKTAWEEFEIRFQQIHTDFHKKLNQKIPNLTPNEKRLCAFLYLNMTTKEISSITFQTVKSIEVARTRLRKKMGIEREDNLISVLQNL